MPTDSLTLLLNITNPAELAEVGLKLGLSIQTIAELKAYSAQFYLTEPAEALRIGMRAYELSCHLPPPASALGAWTLGNALVYNSQYTEADRFYTEARVQYLACGQELEAARAAVGHVGVLAYIGQIDVGLQLAQEIGAILEEAAKRDPLDLQRLGALALNIGVIYELLGDYEEALAVYEKHSHLLNAKDEKTLLARLDHNRAYLLAQMGAFDEALDAYRQAEGLLQETNGHADLVRLYINRSYLLMILQRHEAAALEHKQALQLLARLSDMGQTFHRLTLLQTQLALSTDGKVGPELLAKLQEAQRAFAEHGPVLEEGLVWLLLGRSHLQQGMLQDAQRCYQHVLAMAGKGADRALEVRTLQGLAQVAQVEGEVERAITFYSQAIDLLELIRHELQTELFRVAFLTDKLEVYDELAALLIHYGRYEHAFQIVERAKSRLIAEKLATRLNSEVDRATTSTNAEIRILAEQLRVTLQQLDALYQRARLSHLRGEEQNAAEATPTISALENKAQALVLQIQRHQPIFSTLTLGQTVALPQIQQALDDTLFLQYHTVKDRFGVFLVDRQGIQEHILLAPITEIEEARRAFLASIEQMLGLFEQSRRPARLLRNLPALVAGANQALHRLYCGLVQPLVHALRPGIPIIVSPDRILHSVPFHALYDGASYLLEQHIVSYAPSATVLTYCRNRVPSGKGILLFGFDDQRLAAITDELLGIAQLYPDALLKLGDQATTTTFLAQGPGSRLVHLAAHASFRADKPMFSAISLADRRLTLAEIANLQLNADLVGLSGCETGYGRLQGADLLSLASGFLGAGARTLLVSLWRVEDASTAQLMKHFYTKIDQGVSYNAALRSAQLALLQESRQATTAQSLYHHPAFWAPFILIGNWGDHESRLP